MKSIGSSASLPGRRRSQLSTLRAGIPRPPALQGAGTPTAQGIPAAAAANAVPFRFLGWAFPGSAALDSPGVVRVETVDPRASLAAARDPPSMVRCVGTP